MQRIRENLATYQTRVGIVFLDPPGGIEQQRTKANRNIVTFMKPCGHSQTMQVKNLPANGVFSCTNCELVDRYREKNLEVCFQESTITCARCQRWYQRTSETLTKGLSMFQCYCQLQRDAEKTFYDKFQEHFQENFFRSFSGYGAARNFSSDFHLKIDGKVFILHLNDASHHNPENLERDLLKLEISNEMAGHHNIFIHEKAFLKDPAGILEEVIFLTEELTENPIEGDRHAVLNGAFREPKYHRLIQNHIDLLHGVATLGAIQELPEDEFGEGDYDLFGDLD